jgi:hypothetical protein
VPAGWEEGRCRKKGAVWWDRSETTIGSPMGEWNYSLVKIMERVNE